MLGIDAAAILTATKTFAEGMIKNLNPTVMNLLSSFLIIDLTLSFLFDESEGLNIFIKLLKRSSIMVFLSGLFKNMEH